MKCESNDNKDDRLAANIRTLSTKGNFLLRNNQHYFGIALRTR